MLFSGGHNSGSTAYTLHFYTVYAIAETIGLLTD